jgi:hypothetical protein
LVKRNPERSVSSHLAVITICGGIEIRSVGDHLCDIGEGYAEDNDKSALYYFVMLWSVSYNAYLAKWGMSLKEEAVVAWGDDYGEDFESAKETS